jgi:hypothetical protein
MTTKINRAAKIMIAAALAAWIATPSHAQTTHCYTYGNSISCHTIPEPDWGAFGRNYANSYRWHTERNDWREAHGLRRCGWGEKVIWESLDLYFPISVPTA